MKISCQACGAKYTIADDKVRGKTVKIKCKKCGASIVVSGESGDDASDWSVIVAEGDTRTLNAEQIGGLIQSGEITSGTYAWREGMADWLPIDSIPELASAIEGDAHTVAAPAPVAAARAPAPTMNLDDDDDDDMPTRAGVIPDQLRVGRSPSTPAPARAPAPLPAAGRPGPDLFANPGGDSGPSMFGGSPAASPAASAAASRGSVRPAAPVRPSAHVASDEASGLVDMRALQSALASTKAKPKETKKDESSFDDIMNLGAPPAFEAPTFGAPTINFDAPTIDPMAPNPPAQVAPSPVSMAPGAVAAPAGYAPIPEKKSNVGMIVGIVVGGIVLLGIGGGGVAMMMSGKNEVAKADPASTSTANNPANGAGTPAATTSATGGTAPGTAATDTAKPADPTPSDTTTTDPSTTAKDPKDPKDPKTPSSDKDKDKDKAAKDKAAKEKEDKEKKEKEDKAAKEKADADAAAAAAAASEAPFDRSAAMSALSAGAGAAAGCKTADGPTGSGKVSVTFAPSGRVTQAAVQGAPFAGTSVGSCVASAFRGAKVPPFGGGPVTVSKGFSIN